MSDNDAVAKVLALVQQQDSEVVEPEIDPPPPNSSPAAQALYYSLMREYEFSLGELVIVEQLVAARTMLDSVESAWRMDGCPSQTVGSQGQMVTDGRIQEMRQIRGQIASLVKALNLPEEGGQQRRRPGRPTRAQAAAEGKSSRWGA